MGSQTPLSLTQLTSHVLTAHTGMYTRETQTAGRYAPDYLPPSAPRAEPGDNRAGVQNRVVYVQAVR